MTTTMIAMKHYCEEWKPILAMLAVDVAFGIMHILTKKVIDEGMNRLVLVTLRQLTATIFMAPIAYFREKKSRPKLTGRILLHLFFCALLGATLAQSLFFLGLQHTSATLACAFLNMTPVVTFLIALPFRSFSDHLPITSMAGIFEFVLYFTASFLSWLETLNLKTRPGVAKVLGTAICLSGAMILTSYKGVALTNASHSSHNLAFRSPVPVLAGKYKNWTIGSIALFGCCFCWSSWFLLQSRMANEYPALYSCSGLIFLLSSVQSAALTFASQRGISLWALRGRVEIITVVYSGVVGSGLCFLIMSWCVEKRGPVFTAAFTPLTQIIVAVIEFLGLHEQLHLGSVLGSVLVIAGLYFLLWGKSKESQSRTTKQVSTNSEESQAPEMA